MAPYVSKEEKKIPIQDPTGKWSDLTLLPEWEEKYFDVYTAKKHGKWVMLKGLKKQYADNPEYQRRLEREFDTRYNLAHPNIVMVNDFEEVPGVGMAIITDDVYGYSLRRLIDEKLLSPLILERLTTQLPDAMGYIQDNHLVHYPIAPENIIFTEYSENLKLINVGFDQSDSLSEQDTNADIAAYGRVLTEVLESLPEPQPRLKKIATKCADKKQAYRNIPDLKSALHETSKWPLYTLLCVFIVCVTILIIFFASK